MPNAGLGNILFVWARALIFAKSNGLPIIIVGLNRIHLGPFLRKEKVKRFYLGQFRFPSLPSILTASIAKFFFKKIVEPSTINSSKAIYIFNRIPDWSHFFKDLKPHRKIIVEEFFNLLSKSTLKRIDNWQENEYIAVHIRMGDFRKLEENINFKTVGSTRTPLSYFKDIIYKLQKNGYETTTVKIFSDGYKDELLEILSISNTEYMYPDLDIVDMIKISRAKLIVTSASSTFSEWAGFLSDAPIIRHPDHIHSLIRQEKNLFEGTIDQYLQISNKNTKTAHS